MALSVRKIRHWKQRYVPGASFIWRRSILYNGQQFRPGDIAPDLGRTKERRLWESGTIELANFDQPKDVSTGGDPRLAPQPSSPDEILPVKRGRGRPRKFPV